MENPGVRFTADCKEEDGALVKSNVKMWVSGGKGARVADLLQQLRACISRVHLPAQAGQQLEAYLGNSPPGDSADSPRNRETFDRLMSNFLHLVGLPLPVALRPVVLAVRHSLPCGFPPPIRPGFLTVVCLFPISPSAARNRRYHFDGGWCVDGLFLWLGQEQRQGHMEVVDVLENCCGGGQAVLVFGRTSQSSRHTYVGRARGFIPLCNQDIALRQPVRLAMMLDTSSPFCLGEAVLHPGQMSENPTKASVHNQLGLSPPRKYDRCGYSVSHVSGQECHLMLPPLCMIR